jgi:enoyl-[acyl-carrier protein] reductase II
VLGTRFLASVEMPIDASWKSRIVAAEATDAVKVPNSERVMPRFTLELPPGPRPAPRTLRTSLTQRLETDPEGIDAATVAPTLIGELQANRGRELPPFTGQSAALVRKVLPAAEIVSRLRGEATTALAKAGLLANA